MGSRAWSPVEIFSPSVRLSVRRPAFDSIVISSMLRNPGHGGGIGVFVIYRSNSNLGFSNPITFLSFLTLSIILAALSSCGKEDNDDAENIDDGACLKLASADWAGYSYVGTDLKYTSSSLRYCNFKTGQSKTLLTGESGDVGTFWLENKLYIFNRRSNSHNFRILDPRLSDSASAQTAMTVGAPTDPSNAISLGNGKLLLALGTRGGIAVVDATTLAAQTDAVASNLVESMDLLPAAPTSDDTYPFRPSGMYKYTLEGKDFVAITHLGLTGNYLAADTAQIFIFSVDENQKLTVLDQDPVKDKIQGIKVIYTNPSSFVTLAGERSVALSLCNSAEACKQGFVEFDSLTNTLTPTWDLSAEPFLSNSTMEVGPGGNSVYAGVQFTGGEHKGLKGIVALNYTEKTWSVTHLFPPESSGCCGNVTYIDKTKTLLISDELKDGSGFYDVFSNTEAKPLKIDRLATKQVPRGTLLIPAK